jgi:hypothetical protein
LWITRSKNHEISIILGVHSHPHFFREPHPIIFFEQLPYRESFLTPVSFNVFFCFEWIHNFRTLDASFRPFGFEPIKIKTKFIPIKLIWGGKKRILFVMILNISFKAQFFLKKQT